MNEDEMKRLFAGYRESLGTCGRTPVRRRTPRRMGWAFAAGATVVLVGGLTLWPGDATARAMQRMETALKGVRSMETVTEIVDNGHRRTGLRILYSDGKWRVRNQEGAPLEVTYIAANGTMVTDFARLDHTVREPLDPVFLSGIVDTKTPLQFAKEIKGLDEANTKLRTATHGEIDGRRTYALVKERAGGGGQTEIVVDAVTDLPISIETKGVHHGAELRERTSFRYDLPVASDAFAPPANKPLVDLPNVEAELARRWKKPIVRVGGMSVWDAAVTRDGTVWIAASLGKGRRLLPTALDGFARTQDLVPGAVRLKRSRFNLRGEEVVVSGFVPVDGTRQPTIRVDLSPRRIDAVGTSRLPKEPETSVGPPLELHLRSIDGDRPDFLTPLDLDYYGFQLPILVARTRADALQKEGRTVEAARACEAMAHAYEGWVRYAGHSALERASELYAEAGMPTDAARTRAEAVTLKASRAR